jgi:hypothetical protein
MKKHCIYILFLFIALYSFGQNSTVQKDSLPVYTIINPELASLIDSFVMDAKYYKFPVKFLIYIDTYSTNDADNDAYNDANNRFSLSLNCNRQDSILYAHPYCQRVFILHNNYLFATVLCNFPNLDTIKIPDKFIAKTNKKQEVYYNNTPQDYFRDNKVKGEIIYEDQLYSWGYEYEDGEFYCTIKIGFLEDN